MMTYILLKRRIVRGVGAAFWYITDLPAAHKPNAILLRTYTQKVIAHPLSQTAKYFARGDLVASFFPAKKE
jgi:hypothetical protein